MPIIAPKQRIQAPVTQRLKSGLFSQFAPIEDSSIRWENGVTWEDVARAGVGVISQYQKPGTVKGLPKTLDNPKGTTIESLEPLTVYATFRTTPLDHSPEEAVAIAAQRLAQYEEYAVEDALWLGVNKTGPALTKVQEWANNSGAQAAESAWNAAENYAHTPGVAPVFHMSRRLGGLLAARQYLDVLPDGTARTRLGTPVVLGDGYVDKPPIIASTGPIQIYRGDVFTSTLGAGGFDKGQNDLTAVAERQYVLAFNPDDAYFVKVNTDPGSGKYVDRQF
uniref:Capsid protein n=1 Tax=Dulem virus 38 TaxID=3145756 RepID=A0AAU8B0D9_9CAUD